MTTLTRAEAFDALEHGEDVEIRVLPPGTAYRNEWVPAGYQSFAWKECESEFRIKPKPQRARVFDRVWVNNDNELQTLSAECGLPSIKVREVLPNDMTGRAALDWVLKYHSRALSDITKETIRKTRDSLPEDSE